MLKLDVFDLNVQKNEVATRKFEKVLLQPHFRIKFRTRS